MYGRLISTGAVVLLVLAATLTGRDNPHSFIQDPAGCARCHPERPARPEHIPAGTDEFCVSCHTHSGSSHPLEVPVDLACPPDLLVDAEGKIGCLTCHSAHAAFESDRPWTSSSVMGGLGRMFSRQKTYKTCYLRRNNARGELCLACHKNY